VYVYLPDNPTATQYYNDIEMQVVFYDSSNNTIGTSPTSGIHRVYDNDRWEDNRLSMVATAPAGVSYAIATIQAITDVSSATEIFYLDALLIEQASKINEYFDQLSDTPANEQGREKELVNRALTPTPIPHITGPELNADISLGRLVFNTVDEDGTVWVCTDLIGWWGQTSPDVPDITRGTEDGSFDVSGRYMSRIITLSGVFLPQSRDYLPKALGRLVTETDLVRRTSTLRVDEDPTKIAEVRLVGQPVITTVNSRGRTEFSLTLRAADPIKYAWAINQVHGYELKSINGLEPDAATSPTSASKSTTAVNAGNTTVTPSITVLGPIGSGSTVRATSRDRDETITLVSALRDAGAIARATSYTRDNLVVTVTTDADHGLLVGDTISFNWTTIDYNIDPQVGDHVVTAIATETPFTFSYSLADVVLFGTDGGQDITAPTTIVGGADVKLTNPDTLVIDNYNKEVSFNGTTIGQRSKLEPLIDWIKLDAGTTTVTLTDSFDNYTVVNKKFSRATTTATATVKFDRAHFLGLNETVNVFLPESLAISTTAAVASSDVVTVNTATAHGLGVGDLVTVEVTESRNVTQKAYNFTTKKATLTLNANQSWADTNRISVTLPSTATATSYAFNTSTDIVTITTQSAHGFVQYDKINIANPALSSIATKSMNESGVATLTTRTAHGLTNAGDALIVLPVSTTLNLKAVSGTTVTMSTTTPHGFSISDRVEISLPTSATVDAFAYGGFATQLVTVTTTAAHGFSIGDQITTAFNSTYDPYEGTYYYIQSIPSATSFTYYYFGSQTAAVANDVDATGTITNVTNTGLNSAGTVITSVPSSTTFTYTKAS
jgi:protein involved in polysaccharide export with SLBB domain